MKSGVIPCILTTLLEGSHGESQFLHTNCGPVHGQNTHEQLLSPPERRGLLLQLANRSASSRTNWYKEILVTCCCNCYILQCDCYCCYVLQTSECGITTIWFRVTGMFCMVQCT